MFQRSSFGLFTSFIMVSKGNVTTRLNPLRLNTINHLRVRRPNQHEQNACVTVMSSMLSMSSRDLSRDVYAGWWPSLHSIRRTTDTAPKFFATNHLLTLFHYEQTAGPPRDTATRAVPPLRRNCASAWTHRYVSSRLVPSESFLFLYLYHPKTPTNITM